MKKEVVDGMNVEVGYDSKDKLVTFNPILEVKESDKKIKTEKKKLTKK